MHSLPVRQSASGAWLFTQQLIDLAAEVRSEVLVVLHNIAVHPYRQELSACRTSGSCGSSRLVDVAMLLLSHSGSKALFRACARKSIRAWSFALVRLPPVSSTKGSEPIA